MAANDHGRALWHTKGFVGRVEALETLGDSLNRAVSGALAPVLVEGEAGIGKTRLVERFLEMATLGRVVWVSGAQVESDIDFGVADQLLRVAGDSRGGLLGDGEGGQPHLDGVSVGLALLRRLASLPDDRPAAVVVDDAQWVDAASGRAVLFALRRLMTSALLVVLIARNDEGEPLREGFGKLAEAAVLRVDSLSEEEVHALAASEGVSLSAFATRRLCEHTRGNPLQTLSLLKELPPGAWEDPTSELGAPRAVAAGVTRSVARLSNEAAQFVRAASVLGTRSSLAAITSLAHCGEPWDALDEAIEAGLLQADRHPTTVTFAHPLVRLAVYGALGPGYRARMHLAAAVVADDPEEELRHRAAAAMSADDALARELEACARRHVAGARWAAAHAMLMDGSRLSASTAERERRFLEAVDALLSGNQISTFEAFRGAVLALPSSAHRDYVEAHWASVDGEPEGAEALLARAWEQRDKADSELSAAIAHRFALHFTRQLRGEEAIEWARRAGMRAAVPHAVGLVLLGRSAEARCVLDDAGTASAEIQPARGWVRLLDDDVDGALADLRAAPASPTTYAWLAAAEHAAGLWDDAAAHSRLALASGGSNCAVISALVLALDRGGLDGALDLARRSEARSGTAHDAVLAAEARARIAAARGRWDVVRNALADVASRGPGHPVHEPGLFGWVELYASALLSDDMVDEADAFLRPHEQWAADRGRRSVIVRLLRVRGRLEALRGRREAADETLQRALRHAEGLAMPYELALTQLAYGQFLRRNAHRRAAVRELRRARACLAELGARPALERCDRELRASGLEPVKRKARDYSQLTPQEDTVARLARAGLTNLEIASELDLSAKTVEAHLTHVYAKLGIASRLELPRRMDPPTS